MSGDWKIEDAKVLLYLSEKHNDYAEIQVKAFDALKEWQSNLSHDSKAVLLYWLQNSSVIADPIFSQLTSELRSEVNLEANLELLEGCSQPRVTAPSLLDQLWHLMGTSETVSLIERVAHIIVLLLPSFVGQTSLSFETWWPSIVGSLTRTMDKVQLTAGLKVWLACLTTGLKALKINSSDKLVDEIKTVIKTDTETYFDLLDDHVSRANKIGLQILNLSLMILDTSISAKAIEYNPHLPGVKDAWSRYISLVEILGIDTSIHQTEDSLSDFAAILSADSPIPPRWCVALTNVGLCESNTEGIRVLVMQLIMALQQKQLHAFTEYPKYVAKVLFPKFLQQPNYVVLSGRCLQAEHLREFTRNMVLAFLERDVQTLREFIFELSQFLLENAHCFEAPRVLVAKELLDTIPANCLTARETVPLLGAAKATVLTYTSKALADLYYDLIARLAAKSNIEETPKGKFTDHTKAKTTFKTKFENSGKTDMKMKVKMSLPGEDPDDSIKPQTSPNAAIDAAVQEWGTHGPLSLSTMRMLRSFLDGYPKSQFTFLLPELSDSPNSLLDVHSHLQLGYIQNNHDHVAKSQINDLIQKEINNPRAMSAAERKRLSEALELAFDYVDSTTFELCEGAFAMFSEVDTRFAALRCYRRSKPQNIPLHAIEVLWSHIKDSTLRIIDRRLHLAFIDFLTEPGVVSPETPPLDICLEIVKLSVLKRKLLVPLTRGLTRFAGDAVPAWVFIVMVHVFTFLRSLDYKIQMEEMVALEFGIYEMYWGEPESHARALAATFMYAYCNSGNNTAAVDEATQDLLVKSDLSRRITGSMDNPDAHLRVLQYQAFMLLQRGTSKDVAMQVLEEVKASLEFEANPPVRVQGEWLVGLLGANHLSSSREELGQFILRNVRSLKIESGVPPRVLGSLIRVTMLLYYSIVTRHTVDDELTNQIGEELVFQLVPLATSNKAVVRHRAISAIYILNRNNLAPAALKKMVASIAEVNEGGVRNSSFQNESYLWDLLDIRLGPVCGGVCSTVFDRCMPNTLLESDFAGVNLSAFGLGGVDAVGPCWSPQKVVKENRQGSAAFPDVITFRERIVQEAVNSLTISNASRSIQTKSGTFNVDHQARRTSLIVVATLCDKPVNLGAITRLSDALGASKLTMRDTSIIEDPQFKSTALTAERWIPIEQVAENDLATYLFAKKAEGYTLVGIEQTDTSKQLSANLQFPEKTLLMMGHERQGIPASILSILDACVEIEQLGYVRSMNIQTATAVVVQAYNQNHGPSVHRVDYA